jgi:hypothetical protein
MPVKQSNKRVRRPPILTWKVCSFSPLATSEKRRGQNYLRNPECGESGGLVQEMSHYVKVLELKLSGVRMSDWARTNKNKLAERRSRSAMANFDPPDWSLSRTLKHCPMELQLDIAANQEAGSHSTTRPPSVISVIAHDEVLTTRRTSVPAFRATSSLDCSWDSECHHWRS